MKRLAVATLVLTAALAFCAVAARAAEHQATAVLTAPVHEPTSFETMNEAAVYALKLAYSLSHYYEIGGVITMLDGKYLIGYPTTDFSGVSVDLNAVLDPGHYKGVIVANYHTHPCNSNTREPAVFSPEDLHEDRAFRYPGYMADFCTGDVHLYQPGVDKLPADAGREGWLGTVIGHFPVDGLVLDSPAMLDLL